MKNWKTSLSALVAIVIQFGPVVVPQYITPAIANTITGIATALGLFAAKDFNVTGGTTVNVPNDASVVKEATKTDTK